jgi:hypothetical protein
MPAPCDANELHKDWQEEYDDWKECDEATDELLEDYLRAWATAELACGGAVALSETVVGGIFGGAACVVALWDMYDKWDDLMDQTEKCNAQVEKTDAAGEKYRDCVGDHKTDGQ